MVECQYCNEEFSDEERYLDHLEATHADELGRIDRRRLEQRHADDGRSVDLDLGPLAPLIDRLPQRIDLAIAALVVFVIVMILWTVDFGFAANGVHAHGTLVVEVDGERLDLDQPKYRSPDRFHFHPGDGETWHMHPERLTFEAAMAELGMPVTETSVTIDGTTYDDTGPNTSVGMAINGEPVALEQELHDGDAIVIVVETGA